MRGRDRIIDGFAGPPRFAGIAGIVQDGSGRQPGQSEPKGQARALMRSTMRNPSARIRRRFSSLNTPAAQTASNSSSSFHAHASSGVTTRSSR
jgi:hypothetical protein